MVILALRVDKVTEIALLVPLAAEYRAGVVVTGLTHHIDEMTALHLVDYLPDVLDRAGDRDRAVDVLPGVESLLHHLRVKVALREYRDTVEILAFQHLVKRCEAALYTVLLPRFRDALREKVTDRDLLNVRVHSEELYEVARESAETDHAYMYFSVH